jgi:hypothetical protein
MGLDFLRRIKFARVDRLRPGGFFTSGGFVFTSGTFPVDCLRPGEIFYYRWIFYDGKKISVVHFVGEHIFPTVDVIGINARIIVKEFQLNFIR